MKKIIIFGASGRVGQRLVEYSLAGEYKVTAFVRSVNKVEISHPSLQIVKGDVFNVNEVTRALEGHDIVLSALSGRSTKPDYSVLSVGMQNILSGMKQTTVKRIIGIAGAGILDDTEYGLRRNKPNYPELFKLVSAENWKVYEALKQSSVNWTLVCAPEMPDGKRTGVYRTLPDFLPEGGNRIFVEDVADFILKNLDTENTFQKRIGIAY